MKFIILFLISTYSFNVMSVILTNNLDTGFKVYQTGNGSGAGLVGEEKLNKDERFPYWSSYCEKDKKYLCFPNPDKFFLTIP
ncbi:hypothetical protein GQT22_004657, partial [Salmonella enterica]|nr:hypothetical protein [Salmonella enterica]EDY8664084.1 hypothetical protein [Salmonella enterica]